MTKTTVELLGLIRGFAQRRGENAAAAAPAPESKGTEAKGGSVPAAKKSEGGRGTKAPKRAAPTEAAASEGEKSKVKRSRPQANANGNAHTQPAAEEEEPHIETPNGTAPEAGGAKKKKSAGAGAAQAALKTRLSEILGKKGRRVGGAGTNSERVAGELGRALVRAMLPQGEEGEGVSRVSLGADVNKALVDIIDAKAEEVFAVLRAAVKPGNTGEVGVWAVKQAWGVTK